MMWKTIEIKHVYPEINKELYSLFEDFVTSGASTQFHPHQFTQEKAEEIANYSGRDLYFVLTVKEEICGYGMLRGWDEGYSIPSLGIGIRSNYQGMGLGTLMMEFLHVAAKLKGAKKVRLKVYSSNKRALDMYKKLGYMFQDEKDNQLVGLLEL